MSAKSSIKLGPNTRFNIEFPGAVILSLFNCWVSVANIELTCYCDMLPKPCFTLIHSVPTCSVDRLIWLKSTICLGCCTDDEDNLPREPWNATRKQTNITERSCKSIKTCSAPWINYTMCLSELNNKIWEKKTLFSTQHERYYVPSKSFHLGNHAFTL